MTIQYINQVAPIPLSPALSLLGAREGAAFHLAADEVAVRDRANPANNFLGTVSEAISAGILTFSRTTAAWQTDIQGLWSSVAANVPRLTCDPASLLTSATVMRIGLGIRALTVSAGYTYAAGSIAVISDPADVSRWMAMRVLSHVGSTLMGYVYRTSGSGTGSSWLVIRRAGYLSEPQRTNKFARSTDLTGVGWSKGGCSAPTPTRLTEDTSTGNHHVTQGTSFTAGQVYTCTAIARAAERSGLRINLSSVAFGSTITGNFDLAAGTASGTGTDIKSRGGGVYECRLTATATTTIDAVVDFIMLAGGIAGYTGDGVSGLDILGLQIEEGAYATSTIVTAGSSVTRYADQLTVPLAKLPFNVAEGTVIECAQPPQDAVNNGAYGWQIDDGSNNNRIITLAGGAGLHRRCGAIVLAGATTWVPNSTGVGSSAARYATALAWANNDAELAINGAVGGTNTSTLVPTGMTTAWIGRGRSPSDNQFMAAPVESWTLIPQRQSRPELLARTTL